MKENKQFQNKNKRKLWLCIGGAVAVLLICVVLVGLINGQWPWQSTGAGDYTGLPDVGTSENDTIGTEDPTFNTENIDVTTGVEVPDDDNNTGNSGSSSNSGNSGSNNGGSGTNSGNSGGNNSTDIDFDSLLGAAGNGNSGNNAGSNTSNNSSSQTTVPETTESQTTVPETTVNVDIDIPID